MMLPYADLFPTAAPFSLRAFIRRNRTMVLLCAVQVWG